APPHAGPAGDNVDHAFQGTVVVRAGLGTGLDDRRTGPDLLSPGRCAADRGFAVHAGRLRRVGGELRMMRDPYPRLPPIRTAPAHPRLPRQRQLPAGILPAAGLVAATPARHCSSTIASSSLCMLTPVHHRRPTGPAGALAP